MAAGGDSRPPQWFAADDFGWDDFLAMAETSLGRMTWMAIKSRSSPNRTNVTKANRRRLVDAIGHDMGSCSATLIPALEGFDHPGRIHYCTFLIWPINHWKWWQL